MRANIERRILQQRMETHSHQLRLLSSPGVDPDFKSEQMLLTGLHRGQIVVADDLADQDARELPSRLQPRIPSSPTMPRSSLSRSDVHDRRQQFIGCAQRRASQPRPELIAPPRARRPYRGRVPAAGGPRNIRRARPRPTRRCASAPMVLEATFQAATLAIRTHEEKDIPTPINDKTLRQSSRLSSHR